MTDKNFEDGLCLMVEKKRSTRRKTIDCFNELSIPEVLTHSDRYTHFFTMCDYEKQGLLHEMFQRQAEQTPDKVAIVEAAGRQVTLKELNRHSDILAVGLRQRGVTVNCSVGIYMSKSIEFSTAYIAILKAGGAYLPLDVAYPPQMLESILADAEPTVILTTPELADKVKGQKNIIVMKEGWTDELEKENNSRETTVVSPDLNLDSLAYIVYSSGTTGIMCPHRGSVFSYYNRHVTLPYTEGDREACNIFFTWEMLRPLLKGVPMYVIPNTVIYDPPLLCDFLEKHKITRMLFTPSLLEVLLNTAGLDVKTKLKNMRNIIFCGEVVTTALLDKCLKTLPWIHFINLYSVSECHDVACANLSEYFKTNEVNARKFCPVGKLLEGVKVAILNSDRKPEPVGVSGEIFVGGPTLAHGYLNRPDQQAKRFTPCPESLSPEEYGERLYRTGDWGYLLSDGSLEICGRCDTMVKVRGYSIEVQAVEVALMELTMVQACVVMVEGEEGEDKFLVSYIVPKVQTSKKEIRAELKLRLPFYMIPSYFVLLSSIPVVATTGKLDKAALPAFDKKSETETDEESLPSTETEKQVAIVWKKVLQTIDVDIHESFFDLGGHSLLATELLVSLREKYEVELAVKDLFDHPTIFSISQLIEGRLGHTSEKDIVVSSVNFDLQKEVDRHDVGMVNVDMKLRAFWRLFNLHDLEGKFKRARVFLTGATGFLGAFLLKELLVQTKTFVYCLVRKLPDKPAIERVTETLQQYGILPNSDTPTDQQTRLQQLFNQNVKFVNGNTALINLGMNEDDYAYLCTDIDFIIHAAATVNLVYPYSALQGPNVTGTCNVVQFACTGKIKPIHYISTDGVFPNGKTNCCEADNCQKYSDQLTDGYSQSKWVAEQLMARAGQRGIPVTIYRLGNLSGDRLQAYWNSQDFTLMILKACSMFGVAPDMEWFVEMTPVDFAAEFIVRLTYNLSRSLGKTFHIINTKPLHSRWLFEWMNAHGYPVEIVPFPEWRDRVVTGIQNNGKKKSMIHLQRLLEGYAKDAKFFTELSTYRTDNMDLTTKELGMTYPHTDGDLLHTYFSHLSKREIITTVNRSLKKTGPHPLDGKVAIVTGASSGIGKAVAIALAEAGAKVAMGARRTEKLQEIQKEIQQNSGIAICVGTDVTKRDDVKKLVNHTESVLGPVDILVNNAGTMYYTMMKNLHEDEWERQIDINVKGLTNCIGGVLDGMLKRKSGHIVNMSSDAGRKGFAGLAVYSGTKFYVEGLSQALRQEVCGCGIRVTCIQPGDVKTELLQHTTDKEAKESYDGSSNCKILDPDDIARAIVYAVSQPPHVGVNEILIEPREAPA